MGKDHSHKRKTKSPEDSDVSSKENQRSISKESNSSPSRVKKRRRDRSKSSHRSDRSSRTRSKDSRRSSRSSRSSSSRSRSRTNTGAFDQEVRLSNLEKKIGDLLNLVIQGPKHGDQSTAQDAHQINLSNQTKAASEVTTPPSSNQNNVPLGDQSVTRDAHQINPSLPPATNTVGDENIPGKISF